jgi:hypothetical protein
VIVLTRSQSGIQFIPYDQAYAPGFEDMRRRVPSIEKISRLTGYQPSYTLDEMLESVIFYERDQLMSGQPELIELNRDSTDHPERSDGPKHDPW